jgi:hypothetical protein
MKQIAGSAFNTLHGVISQKIELFNGAYVRFVKSGG